MTNPISSRSVTANARIVRIGSTEVLFSYDTVVAFSDHANLRNYVNPDYRKFSKTTSTHLARHGYENEPDAPSGAHFAAYLADALLVGAKRAQDDVIEANRAA